MLPSSIKKPAVSKPLYHYVVVRSDLSTGFAMAQVVHASGESLAEPVQAGTYAVVLSVPDEATLRSLAASLARSGVDRVLVEEPDPPYCGEATAIGLTPTHDRQALSRILGRLPLLR